MSIIAKLKELISERYFWKVNSLRFNAIYSFLTLILFNKIYFEKVWAVNSGFWFILLMSVVLFALLNVACALLFWKRTVKPLAVLFMLVNAFVFYFMFVYHTAVDKVMLLNVLETDVQEVKALLSPDMLLIVGMLGILPSYLIYKTEIVYGAGGRELVKKFFAVLLFLAVIVGIVGFGYKDAAQFLRNNKPLKHYLVPVNYIGAIISVTKNKIREARTPKEIVKTGEDALLSPLWKNNGKKNLFIFVVGETARAANFSLNGYHQPTNAPLKKFEADILSFKDVSSCGTSTAIALPCLFSHHGRKNFNKSESYYTENLLDIAQRAGYKVWWRGNVTGCKGICTRVESEILCKEDTCYDDILAKGLKERLQKENKDMFVVLHQLGSHGPTYYKRYPKEKSVFEPNCNTERLDKCSREEILNVYDNTIHYTSENLAEVIEILKSLKDEYNSMLLYVSDHGESLGENNIYLHAAPYALAPKEQTQVPLILWFDDDFADKFNLDRQCLRKKLEDSYSQDNIFHSFLGVMGIKTSVYDKNMDIFSSCRL